MNHTLVCNLQVSLHITTGGQNRWPPLEAFIGLYTEEFFLGVFFNLPIGAENASGAFGGQKMVSGTEKIAPNVLNLRTQKFKKRTQCLPPPWGTTIRSLSQEFGCKNFKNYRRSSIMKFSLP